MNNSSAARAGLFLRLVLGITMLSAVADRFGLWGAPGSPNVAWGNWANFVAYTQTLNAFAGKQLGSILAIFATAAEILLGLLLIIGFKTRLAALATGILMLLFAMAMTISVSIKAPLDYSVFTSAGAAFLLSAIGRTAFALDNTTRK